MQREFGKSIFGFPYVLWILFVWTQQIKAFFLILSSPTSLFTITTHLKSISSGFSITLMI